MDNFRPYQLECAVRLLHWQNGVLEDGAAPGTSGPRTTSCWRCRAESISRTSRAAGPIYIKLKSGTYEVEWLQAESGRYCRQPDLTVIDGSRDLAPPEHVGGRLGLPLAPEGEASPMSFRSMPTWAVPVSAGRLVRARHPQPLAGLLLALAIASLGRADWPMPGHDPARSSWAAQDKVEAVLRPIWHRKIGPYIPSKVQIITVAAAGRMPALVLVSTLRGIVRARSRRWPGTVALSHGDADRPVADGGGRRGLLRFDRQDRPRAGRRLGQSHLADPAGRGGFRHQSRGGRRPGAARLPRRLLLCLRRRDRRPAVELSRRGADLVLGGVRSGDRSTSPTSTTTSMPFTRGTAS